MRLNKIVVNIDMPTYISTNFSSVISIAPPYFSYIGHRLVAFFHNAKSAKIPTIRKVSKLPRNAPNNTIMHSLSFDFIKSILSGQTCVLLV